MAKVYTYQTFEEEKAAGRLTDFVQDFVRQHESSEPVKLAKQADLYDRWKNPGAESFSRAYAEMLNRLNKGMRREVVRPDMVKSNLFRKLNVQRAAYSLGNGVTFAEDSVKDKLGKRFDETLFTAGYYALIHGESFVWWNKDHITVYKLDEFAPLYDEETGVLRAGVRYWQLNPDTPIHYTLYEEDGYTEYTYNEKTYRVEETAGKKHYIVTTVTTDEGGLDDMLGENYSSLPIVPLWGSDLHQSTLVGLKAYIDNMDLVMSGFCNDLQDCAQVYWLCENFGGMTDQDLQDFMTKLNLYHIAGADTSQGGKITPYTTEIPVTARQTLMQLLHERAYEDFGGLDVHCVSADSTNDHLDAAYEPLNHNADDFEKQLIGCIQQIAEIAGIGEVSPIFTRSKIVNTAEQVSMVLSEAAIIGAEAAIDLLPNIDPEMKEQIKKNLLAERAQMEVTTEDEDE